MHRLPYFHYTNIHFSTILKVQQLVRGDLQHVVGETEGPVSRVESIFILISVAVYHELELFKIDVRRLHIKVFMDNGYRQLSKGRCVMVKTEGGKVSYCAITTDDCFFAITKDENWINEAVDMLKRAFEELTVEHGECLFKYSHE